MADTDQSLYTIRYNQVLREMEGFGGGSPLWTPLTISNASNTITRVASDPVSPTEGTVWYNLTTHLLKYYDGTTVQTVAHV